jgi:hypothetical protein
MWGMKGLANLTVHTTDCEKHLATFVGTSQPVEIVDAKGGRHVVRLQKGMANGQPCWAASTPENGIARRGWTKEEAIRAQAHSCGWPQSV